MSSTSFPTLPVVFFEPDDEAASSTLAKALQETLPPGTMILGLLLKVEQRDGQEKLVNWQFTDHNELKLLSLALPEGGIPPSEE